MYLQSYPRLPGHEQQKLYLLVCKLDVIRMTKKGITNKE